MSGINNILSKCADFYNSAANTKDDNSIDQLASNMVKYIVLTVIEHIKQDVSVRKQIIEIVANRLAQRASFETYAPHNDKRIERMSELISHSINEKLNFKNIKGEQKNQVLKLISGKLFLLLQKFSARNPNL